MRLNVVICQDKKLDKTLDTAFVILSQTIMIS